MKNRLNDASSRCPIYSLDPCIYGMNLLSSSHNIIIACDSPKRAFPRNQPL